MKPKTPAPQPPDLKVIEDGFITKMILNPAYVSAFGFLKQYVKSAKARDASCYTCGGARKARVKSVDYTEIKRTLAAMPDDKKKLLLKMTGARAVRFWYRDRAGKIVKLTIGDRA